MLYIICLVSNTAMGTHMQIKNKTTTQQNTTTPPPKKNKQTNTKTPPNRVNSWNTSCAGSWPVHLTVFLRGVHEGRTFIPTLCSPRVSFYKSLLGVGSLENPGFFPNAKRLSILFPCNPVGIKQQDNRPQDILNFSWFLPSHFQLLLCRLLT